MTASYRPVRQHETWCSLTSAEMTISERYGHLYLLTSPHTNAIGCYSLVLRIAAAEAGLSTDELKNVLDRLEEKGVALYRAGFVLVRTWFRHSTWESTFTGNVAKAAAREAAAIPEALRSPWIDACVECGVPADVVEAILKKSLPSPSKGASKGLPDNNSNRTGPSTRTTTTPATHSGECGDASGGGGVNQVYLLPIAEIHRGSIEKLGIEYDLSADQLQQIAYELSQRMEDEAAGRGKPITLVLRWLGTLAKAAASGERILDRGTGLADRHAEAERRARASAREQESARLAAAAADAQRAEVAKLLAELPEQDLSKLADLSVALCDKSCIPQKTRDSIREAVLARTLLGGLGGVAVSKAAHQWIAQATEL